MTIYLNEPKDSSAPLYEQLADSIAYQIDSGTFRPGDRIPSVRQASRQWNLSATTILQAYRLLEDRGLIFSHPQSGYYVRLRRAVQSPEPEISDPLLDPCQIDMSDLSMMVIRDTLNPKLVQFGAALPDPDLLPTQKLNRIMAELIRDNELPQAYTGTPEGTEELRTLVAQRAFLAGCSLTPEDIVITSGGMEAISLALRTVCRPGDLVAIESPTFYGILQAMEAQQLKALEIPTHYQDGISLDALRFALNNHPISAVVLVTNFNNPLGSCMPEHKKRELAALLAEKDVPLIEDDIYGELSFHTTRPSVVKAYDKKGQVLLCSSYSKDISPSYRVGWIAPGRYRNALTHLKMASTLSTALLPQLTIARFIAGGGYDQLLRRMRRAYAQKISGLSQAIQRYFPADTRVTYPQGGYVLWVQLPENVDSLVLYKEALKAGVTFAPGYLFSASSQYKNFIRLNAAIWSEHSIGAVQRLGELVDRMNKRKGSILN